jgi:hypothetical protein
LKMNFITQVSGFHFRNQSMGRKRTACAHFARFAVNIS